MVTEEKYTDNFRKLLHELKHYLGLQKEYAMMETADKLTVILSAVAIAAVCLMLGGMVLFFLTFALAYWIGSLTGDIALGFICISAFIMVLLFVVYCNRNAWFVQPLARMMIRLFVTHKEEEEVPNEQG